MAEKKDVFKSWKEEQVVYNRIALDSIKVDDKAIRRIRKKLSIQVSELQSLSIFDPKLAILLKEYKVPSPKELEAQLSYIYSMLSGDVDAFVTLLHQGNTKFVCDAEKQQGVNALVKKYTDLFDFLGDEEVRFTIANRFFEYCFSERTFSRFESFLSDPAYHPIVRMFYSIIWTNLAEIGWQHWNRESLKALQEQARTGKEVVYIAGGTDIYQLIKHGIYNIRVIDPLLPTQPKYYSKGWDWFIAGDDDEHKIRLGAKTVTMKRISFVQSKQQFSVKLSNKKKETFAQSVLKLGLYDGKKLIGTVVFERRLTNQDDFSYSPKRTVLISFNELHYVSSPQKHGGWGIDPKKFDDRLEIIVKQLEKPVNKEIVGNLRREITQTDFAFIGLGSCID